MVEESIEIVSGQVGGQASASAVQSRYQNEATEGGFEMSVVLAGHARPIRVIVISRGAYEVKHKYEF